MPEVEGHVEVVPVAAQPMRFDAGEVWDLDHNATPGLEEAVDLLQRG